MNIQAPEPGEDIVIFADTGYPHVVMDRLNSFISHYTGEGYVAGATQVAPFEANTIQASTSVTRRRDLPALKQAEREIWKENATQEGIETGVETFADALSSLIPALARFVADPNTCGMVVHQITDQETADLMEEFARHGLDPWILNREALAEVRGCELCGATEDDPEACFGDCIEYADADYLAELESACDGACCCDPVCAEPVFGEVLMVSDDQETINRLVGVLEQQASLIAKLVG